MVGTFVGAACLAAFLALASGFGRMVLLRARVGGSNSLLIGSYLVGFVAFSCLYAVAAELHMPLRIAVAGTVAFLVLGASGLLVTAWYAPRAPGGHALIALGVAAYWLIGSFIAGNEGAIDPWFYAAGPAAFMNWDWLNANVAGLDDSTAVVATLQAIAITRAGATSLLWPLALVGNAIGVSQVVEAGVGLLLVTAFLCADLLPFAMRRLTAFAVSLGAIGVYNAIAVLSGGQIQQAFALFVVVASVWLVRVLPGRASWFVFGVCGFLVSASYPEFLIALPVYWALVVVMLRQSVRATLAQIAGGFAGFLAEQLVTRGGSLAYLISQSTATPGWHPLAVPADGLGAVLVDLILETRPPVAALVLVGVAGCLAWARWRPSVVPSAGLPRQAFALAGLAAPLWILSLVRTPNLDYAVFKLGGWLGPAVVLLAFWFVLMLEDQVQRRLAYAVVLVFALARCASLIYGGSEVLSLAPSDAAQHWFTGLDTAGGCVVEVDGSQPVRTVGAIAGSGASFRNCSLEAARAE